MGDTEHGMYSTVCNSRFTGVEQKIEKVDDKVEKIGRVVFNGLSHIPGRMNWLLGILVSFLIGVISLVWVTARAGARTDAMLEVQAQQTERVLEEVQNVLENQER